MSSTFVFIGLYVIFPDLFLIVSEEKLECISFLTATADDETDKTDVNFLNLVGNIKLSYYVYHPLCETPRYLLL